jgi:formate dehydrogenase subunit gamma
MNEERVMNALRLWKLFGALALSWGMSAYAQAPAAPAAPAVDAAKAAAPTDAKPAPALPPGSTAAPGWNVPPKWDTVQTKPQYASVPGRETNVLEQDAGQWWRTVRNGPVTFYGGLLVLIVPILLLAFYAIKGPIKLHDKPSGRMIERFNSVERMAHWTMATSFVVLALTGLTILFGKYVLMPVLGASFFAWLSTIGKNLHNFVGPLFIFSLIVTFLVFLKDNYFESRDFDWLAKAGGMFSEAEVPSGRFNGGEKLWFWLGVVILGLGLGVTGLIMLFPNWDTSRELMGQANIFHAILAVVFFAGALAHIYMGTIGTEGAYQGMREGYVDETWAKEHHVLWYEEVKAGKHPAKTVGQAQPAAGDD